MKRIKPKSLIGVKVATFDTRFNADEIKSAGLRFIVKTGGYAGRRIANQLKKAGGNLIVPAEGFYPDEYRLWSSAFSIPVEKNVVLRTGWYAKLRWKYRFLPFDRMCSPY